VDGRTGVVLPVVQPRNQPSISAPGEITELLAQVRLGDSIAESHLAALVYDELHRIASRYMRNERPDHSLQATALVDDAYVHLVIKDDRSWQNRSHFFAVASQMMHHILIDLRAAGMRPSAVGVAPPCAWMTVVISDHQCEELMAVDEALCRLAARDPRLSRIVEMRFFAGLTE
jgi:RNA polymerase sigma-70 factor (ECF subfamily)